MMKKNCPRSPAGETQGAPVIGQLQLEGYPYRIIELQAGQKDSVWPLAECQNLLCRFEVNGRLCGIVPGDDAHCENEHDLMHMLTAREVQIATLVALGRLNKQIADHLHIREWPVSTHVRRMCAKLHVRTRAAMVYRCASLIELNLLHRSKDSFFPRPYEDTR